MLKDRLKLLLEAHHQDLKPEVRQIEPGTLLMRQGEPASHLMLLTQGRVAIQLCQEPLRICHTLAVIEAEELLGEMSLFGIGQHTADVRVVEASAEVVVVDGSRCLKAMLYDVDIAMEMLTIISQRCVNSNTIIGELLEGIAAARHHSDDRLQAACQRIRPHGHALALAADDLLQLADHPQKVPISDATTDEHNDFIHPI